VSVLLAVEIFVVAEDPGSVGADIAVRRKSQVENSVEQEQARAFLVLAGIEGGLAGEVGEGGLNFFGAAKEFGAGGDVEGVEAMMIIPLGILGHGAEVDGAVSASIAVDDGRVGNADFRRDLAAATRIAGRFAIGDGDAPERGARVGVERVDHVVFGGDEDNVVRRAGDAEVRKIERLGVHFASDREFAEEAEGSGVDVGSGEDGFVGIEAAAGEVVFVGGDIDAGGLNRIDGEGGVVAGGVADGIGNHNAEGGSIVR
jgi:hypothetical protein